MAPMRHRFTWVAVALVVVCATARGRAQALPAGVFSMDRFARHGLPTEKSLDGEIHVINPGSVGLKAWGTHVEVTPPSWDTFITETPFQDATLSPAELDELTGRCAAIVDNGSGAGRCHCRGEVDGARIHPTTEPGATCADLYVFAEDQQLTECCACPVTPDGLVTLSVRDDLTSNPLTGEVPDRGVIALLTSLPMDGECDPTVPSLPTTSTTTSTTTTTSSTSTTMGTATTTTTTTLVTTTTIVTTTTTTVEGTARAAGLCDGLTGLASVDCTIANVGVRPTCDPGTTSPAVEKLLGRRMRSVRRAVDGADPKGGKVLARAIHRADGQIDATARALAKAAKKRHLSGACMTLLDGELAAARAAIATLP